MPHVLVLGIGNILLRDEGVGVRIVERLQASYHFPEEVRVLDGGTMGLDLLACLEGVERLLVIDAVDAGHPPGTLIRLEGEDIPAFLSHKISPHQVGLADLLSVARLCHLLPPTVVLFGVQPASLETGLELSPTVSAQVAPLVRAVLQELQGWGVSVSDLPATCDA
ncbi:MAG: HyaD/HybD family hydrogenase maturation endopeptidase [Chloroflexaceae bacterium]|nr:HyaD/HybD family hydrogenase maturation endopeptidase [Chloroflexaceae bacterium]